MDTTHHLACWLLQCRQWSNDPNSALDSVKLNLRRSAREFFKDSRKHSCYCKRSYAKIFINAKCCRVCCFVLRCNIFTALEVSFIFSIFHWMMISASCWSVENIICYYGLLLRLLHTPVWWWSHYCIKIISLWVAIMHYSFWVFIHLALCVVSFWDRRHHDFQTSFIVEHCFSIYVVPLCYEYLVHTIEMMEMAL